MSSGKARLGLWVDPRTKIMLFTVVRIVGVNGTLFIL